MGRKQTKKPNLSKSQYMRGLQCEKSLWLYRHKKSAKQPFNNSARQALFDMGKEVGDIAQKYYRGAIIVDVPYWENEKAKKITEKFITDGKKLIYEATAINPTDGSYARVDMLKKVRGSDEWDLIEVKSATSIKPEYLEDIAFQYHVFTGAGYKIRKCILMHIDGDYVRQGDIIPKKLFKQIDLTKDAKSRQDTVVENVERLNKVLALKTEPVKIEENHCNKPVICSDVKSCWGDIPLYSIFNAFMANKANNVFRNIGSYNIEDITPEFSLSYAKNIEVECHKNNQAYADKGKAGEFLDTLEYPVYYLDYETIMSPIPLYDGTKPYQQIPFQFSLHVQKKPGGPVTHVEYLHKEDTDPRENLTKALVKACGKKGSVVVYSQSFEEGRNKELAEAFPEHKKALDAINGRMVDLLVPFRSRVLYHPDQEGSASLKKVLPAWTNLSYDNMDLSDGFEAMGRYRDFIEGKLDKEETKKLWDDLLEYCTQDTYAMVALIKTLSDIYAGKDIPQLKPVNNGRSSSEPKP